MNRALRSPFLLLTALLASCASDLHMPAKELADLEHDEGRAFGSIEVLVAPSDVEPARERAGGLLSLSGIGGLFTEDASDVDFKVTFTRKGGGSHGSLALKPGAPRAWAARLEQGEYSLTATCSYTPGEIFELRPSLVLGAGETLYAGRLQLLVPAKVGELGTLALLDARVTSSQGEDLALLGEAYRAVLGQPIERLLR